MVGVKEQVLLISLLPIVIKPTNCQNEGIKLTSKPKHLSKGQPNVNLLTFASDKHKPIPKHLSCAVVQKVVLQKRFFFHMVYSDIDGSLLCFLA